MDLNPNMVSGTSEPEIFLTARGISRSHWYTRPGERLHFAMENHHAINGKIHYFDWAIFNCFLYVHQRVPVLLLVIDADVRWSNPDSCLSPMMSNSL